MNTSRSALNKFKPLKYNYKPQHAASFNKSITSYQTDHQSTFKKQSRNHKKSQNHNQPSTFKPFKQSEHNSSFRDPLQDYTKKLNIQNYKSNVYNQSEFQKKELSHLKRKNKDLQDRVKDQEQYIRSLKEQLKTVKGAIDKKSYNVNNNQTDHLREVNSNLQQKYDHQHMEMQTLKDQIADLKSALENSKITQKTYSRIEESNVSRRAVYAKNYQIATQALPSNHNKPIKHSKQSDNQNLIDQMQSMKQKYSNELCRLQAQISRLKQKQMMIGVLQQQIHNKNQCIDFLRKQLQAFEVNSKQLLETISFLQLKISEISTTNRPVSRDQERYSFGTYNHSKY